MSWPRNLSDYKEMKVQCISRVCINSEIICKVHSTQQCTLTLDCNKLSYNSYSKGHYAFDLLDNIHVFQYLEHINPFMPRKRLLGGFL